MAYRLLRDMPMSSTWAVARQAAFDFIDDDALTLGAALAYYTALAMRRRRRTGEATQFSVDGGVNEE